MADQKPKLKISKESVRPGFRKHTYLSPSNLERSILQVARYRESSIEGIVVEFVAGAQPNWKVSGIASGKVDAKIAFAVVLDAARQFATTSIVVHGGTTEDPCAETSRPLHRERGWIMQYCQPRRWPHR